MGKLLVWGQGLLIWFSQKSWLVAGIGVLATLGVWAMLSLILSMITEVGDRSPFPSPHTFP